jgi:hypothetical protein
LVWINVEGDYNSSQVLAFKAKARKASSRAEKLLMNKNDFSLHRSGLFNGFFITFFSQKNNAEKSLHQIFRREHNVFNGS